MNLLVICRLNKQDFWTCEKCTLVNEPNVNRCAVCNAVRPTGEKKSTNIPFGLPVRQCSETMEVLRMVEESEALEQMKNILNNCKTVKITVVCNLLQ